MSFGKNPQHLAGIATYRQAANLAQKRPKISGGGGGSFLHWRDSFQPSLVHTDTIRLIAGNYTVELSTEDGQDSYAVQLPNFCQVEHFFALNEKSCFCSGGPLRMNRKKREPCLGCDEFWGGMTTNEKGKKKRGAMGLRDLNIFSVLHYSNYHHVEQTDKQGNFRTNKEGKPYMDWLPCEGHPCQYCRAQKETKLGHMCHWRMGMGHYNTLLDTDSLIGNSCKTCGQRDCIFSRAWLCQNPECGDAVIDLDTTSLSPIEIKKITLDRVSCNTCSQTNLLKEYFECQNCSQTGKEPQRATLFDVDLQVMRVKTSKDGNEQTTLQIHGWSDPRPIDARFAEIAKPLDLPKIYAPTPLDVQAKTFGLPMPAATVPQGQAAPATAPVHAPPQQLVNVGPPPAMTRQPVTEPEPGGPRFKPYTGGMFKP